MNKKARQIIAAFWIVVLMLVVIGFTTAFIAFVTTMAG